MKADPGRKLEEIWRLVQVDFQNGNLEGARRRLKKLCHGKHDSADVRLFLGVVNERMGKHLEARHCYERATQLRPDYPEAFFNLGHLIRAQGKPGEAVSSLRRALELRPAYAEACNVLGLTYMDLQDTAGAERAFESAISIRGNYAEAWFNLGTVYQARKDLDAACAAYEKSAKLQPDNPSIAVNLGCALAASGKNKSARQWLEKALFMQPGHPVILNNLAGVAINEGLFEEALDYCEKAFSSSEAAAEPSLLFNRGKALVGLMRFDEGREFLSRANELNPEFVRGLWGVSAKAPVAEDSVIPELTAESMFSVLLSERLHACDWSNYDGLLGKAVELMEASRPDQIPAIVPFVALHLPVSAALRLKIAKDRSSYIETTVRAQKKLPPVVCRSVADSPLRIGYVSPDFGSHATAHLSRSLYRQHDRSRVEVYAYSLMEDDGSEYFSSIRDSCDTFKVLASVSNRAAAEMIRDDRIDILVDMAGYTRDSRLEIFAHRAAPVQVAFLGYPGTTGAEYIDYIVADDVVLPESRWADFTETPVLMPNSYQVNDSEQAIDSGSVTRAEEGLPGDAFVFCCFNGPLKFNPDNFSAWVEILDQVPNSVLWLLAGNEQMKDNLTARMREAGIAPERLVFAERRPKSSHLRRLGLADLCIDYGVCVAHTTAADALWAGVPLLACPADDSFAARVSSSLLNAVGLSELVISDRGTFISRAVELATDGSELRVLRDRLAKQREICALFDTSRYVADLERGYEEIWAQVTSGSTREAIRL